MSILYLRSVMCWYVSLRRSVVLILSHSQVMAGEVVTAQQILVADGDPVQGVGQPLPDLLVLLCNTVRGLV